MLRAAVFLAALAVLTQAPEPPRRVLFIGNSLTLANGLPQIVKSIARESGSPLEVGVVARPGFSLEDHWNDGEARRVIADGRWSLVVLQQGPSSQPDSARMLRDYVGRFSREARRRAAAVGLYMVWPPRSGPGTFLQVSDSYTRAAEEVQGLLLPVGEAVRAALAAQPHLPVLGPDGFHPTPLGSLLAALVIVQGVTDRAPAVPRSLMFADGSAPLVVSDDLAATLRRAAGAAGAAPSARSVTQ
jgi:hypothetical protein